MERSRLVFLLGRGCHRLFSLTLLPHCLSFCQETLHNFHHNFIHSLSAVKAVDESAANDVAAPPVASADAAAAAAASSPGIPTIFLQYSDFFRLYIPYLNGYERCLTTFNELRKHKKFSDWLNTDVRNRLKEHAAASGTSQLDLLSYMIQPVQRVPRYVLLLKELKRQTSPSHPEFEPLGEALVAVQRVALIINEGQRAVENMSKLMAVQQRIIGEFETLIQPHRRLIKEGIVSATYTHGMFSTLRTRRSVFFLFSDLLLWTSEDYKFKGSIDLTPAKLAPKTSISFVIDTATRVVQVALENEAETKEWFEAIDNVVWSGFFADAPCKSKQQRHGAHVKPLDGTRQLMIYCFFTCCFSFSSFFFAFSQLQNEREKLRQRARVQKARKLNGTANKDAVHQLVTQSLQGLTLGGAGAAAAAAAAGGAGSDDVSNGGADDVDSRSSNVSFALGSGGTIGRGSGGGPVGTLGHRSGRKWDEALDASEQKQRKEQEQQHAAAFSREKIGADTFAPPEDDSASPPASSSAAAASAAAPASAGGAVAPVVSGDRKFVARFVNRRGRSTLGKRDCLCTTILIHAECPKHGTEAMANAAAAAAAGGGEGGGGGGDTDAEHAAGGNTADEADGQ